MRWTIQKKLYLGFIVAGALLAGSVALAYLEQSKAQATQQKIAGTYALIVDLEHLSAYLSNARATQRGYMISGDEQQLASLGALRQDAASTMDRVQAAVKNNPEQNQTFAQWQANTQQGRKFLAKINAARKGEGFEAAKTLFLTGEDDRITAQQLVLFDAIKSSAMAQLSSEEADDARLEHTVAWAEALALLVALGLLSGVAVTLAHSIARNVHTSVNMLEAMAQKDLSIEDGAASTEDELAGAIQAINQMKHSISDALAEVARSSAQVAGAGAEIESPPGRSPKPPTESRRVWSSLPRPWRR